MIANHKHIKRHVYSCVNTLNIYFKALKVYLKL